MFRTPDSQPCLHPSSVGDGRALHPHEDHGQHLPLAARRSRPRTHRHPGWVRCRKGCNCLAVARALWLAEVSVNRQSVRALPTLDFALPLPCTCHRLQERGAVQHQAAAQREEGAPAQCPLQPPCTAPAKLPVPEET